MNKEPRNRTFFPSLVPVSTCSRLSNNSLFSPFTYHSAIWQLRIGMSANNVSSSSFLLDHDVVFMEALTISSKVEGLLFGEYLITT
jgi:hypothetical protein